MCGIVGIMDSTASSRDLHGPIERLHCAIIHRGPDDKGSCLRPEQGVGLAHTRLSILDLSPAGHQPMQDSVTGNWIVFNGEIYNYRELREQLQPEIRDQRSEVSSRTSESSSQRSAIRSQTSEVSEQSAIGHQPSAIGELEGSWHSNSDTEVILRAYAKWGKDCVARFRGMFAFAIWDEREKDLFLARDPFGIKPLYYYQTNDTFIFASELRALLASELVPRRLSQEGLASYLQFGSTQDPLTIIDNVQSLLPGYCLSVKRSGNCLETQQFPFSPTANTQNQRPNTTPKSRPEAVTQMRHILEDSVRHHLVSDVPVAAFLSGGIDSSAIVALMSRVTSDKPKTFSVAFAEKEFSESPYAKLLAAKFGTDHQEIMLSESDLFRLLPSALDAMDQPTMDGVNTYVVSKAVRDAGMKVALSGLGGDELFAGYPSFHRAQQVRSLGHVPFAIRKLVSRVGHAAQNSSARNRKLWDMVGSDCSPYTAYSLSRQLFSPREISALMDAPVRGKGLEVRSATPHASRLTPHETDVINAVSRYELQGYMVNTLLRDTDQMSMAHALEVRVPFVDSKVVEFVLGLPGEWKLDGSRPKPLLLDALGDLLPEEIWRRPKMGFTLPFQKWMQSALEPELHKTFADENGTARLGIDSDQVRDTWDAFKRNPNQEPWSRPWTLYVLRKWCEKNRVFAK
jgi:asparagine synthase (glutamine-hydrolysing)